MSFAQIWHYLGRLAADARFRFAARLIISGVLVAVALKAANIDRVFSTVIQVRWLPLAAAMLLFLMASTLVCLRWRLILNRMGLTLPLPWVVHLCFKSAFVGVILPTSVGGDVARAALLRRSGAGWGLVGASIYLDRFYGLVAIGLAGMPGLVIVVAMDLAPAWMALSLGAVLVLPMLILTVAAILSSRLRDLPSRRTGLFAGLVHLVKDMGARVRQGIVSREVFAPAVVLSLVSQTINILCVSLLGLSCDIKAPLGVYFIFTPLVWLASLAPISISGVGLREIGFGLLFRSVGLSFEHGMVLGGLMSAVTIATVVIGGLVAMVIPMAAGPSQLSGSGH
ncbi:MAG: hypothetical protein BGN85_03475 [Alphaproteobacteria bacterium 64-11]|nr:flippase-like domain-containing protein [Alphaproteobacteria bacterium]OJU10814.1 MAG: hypothetical protein BGN85_03475 [Alphaproteobacteria bacterium 64-11]